MVGQIGGDFPPVLVGEGYKDAVGEVFDALLVGDRLTLGDGVEVLQHDR